jgi:hypothetical protein
LSELRTSEAALLTKGNYFIDCCCTPGTTGSYWDAISCSGMNTPGRKCFQTSYESAYKDRIFVKDDSNCNGVIHDICECQRLGIQNYSLAQDSAPTGVIGIIWTHSDPNIKGIAEYNFTGVPEVTLNATGIGNIYSPVTISLTGTISEAVTSLNGLSAASFDGHFEFFNPSFDFLSKPARLLLSPQSFPSMDSGDTEYFTSKELGIYLRRGEIRDAFLPIFGQNEASIVVALNTIIQSTFGLDGGGATYNDPYSDEYPDARFFDLKLGCGRPFDPIEIDYVLDVNLGVNLLWGGDPDYSYFSPNAGGKEYFVEGTFDICPYESGNIGPRAFNASLQCCPQVGGRVTKENYNNPAWEGYDIGGFIEGVPFDNLNNAFKYQNKCFSLSPSFFLMGMEGKLYKNYFYDKKKHIKASKTDVSIASGIFPNNCSYELFLPLFHPDVPWGPFGSYCPGIDTAPHLAWTSPYADTTNPETEGGASYLSVSYPFPDGVRYGKNYRPFATMKTRGSWLNTEFIDLYVSIKEPIPFAVGTGVFDDLLQLAHIDDTSPPAGFTIGNHAGGCNPTNIIFETSGRTVADFVNGLNSLTLKGYPDFKVFAFALGSDYAGTFPASKIVNVSSEIFELYTLGFTGENPDGDDNLLSGSSVVMPKPYPYYFGNSLPTQAWQVIGGPPVYYGSPGVQGNVPASIPPSCRLLGSKLPKDGNVGSPQNLNNMWWTSMPITREKIFNVALIDPVFTYATCQVATGKMDLSVYGLFSATTGINLLRGGSEFKVEDLIDEVNAITFTSSGTDYTPFSATGFLPYDYWLDDQTSVSSGVYTYGTANPTSINYSYKEQLIDTELLAFTNSTDLYGLHRRRCNYGMVLGEEKDLYQDYCIPNNDITLETNFLDCDGDREIQNGWILTQGCDSNQCITKYYLRAERCPCATVSRCENGQPKEVPHPYNQIENGLNGETWGGAGWLGYTVCQPTLYVCEYNFYPDCDIPVMIKVPFLVQTPNGTYALQDGTRDDLPGYDDFCRDDLDFAKRSNLYGWCQYINFNSLPAKVKEEDIPRFENPQSYVLGRSCGLLCVTNPWNLRPKSVLQGTAGTTYFDGPMGFTIPDGSVEVGDPGYGDAIDCNFLKCHTCSQWAQIYGLGVVFESNTVYTTDAPVYFRAVLKDVVEDDISNNGGLNRVDVDCSTVCCESWYTCDQSIETGPELGALIVQVRHPFTQSKNASYSVSTVSLGGCDIEYSGEPGCRYPNFGPCIVPPQPEFCYGPTCATNSTDAFDISWSNSWEIHSCGCSQTAPVCVSADVVRNSDCGYSFAACGEGCANYTAPTGPPGSVTLCYQCDDLPFPLIISNGTAPFYSIEDGSGCPSGNNWGYVIELEGEVTTTSSEDFKPCGGAGTYTYSSNSTGDYTWTGGNSACIPEGSVAVSSSTSASLTVGAISWSSPSSTLPTSSQTYSDLETFWDGKELQAGFANYSIVTALGAADTRLHLPACIL